MKHEGITALMEEDDVLLPDGWQEDVDIFTDEDWAGERLTEEGAEPVRDPEDMGEGEEAAPTTERQKDPGDEDGKAGETGAPTTGHSRMQSNKLKFKARVDRQDLDVEVDESELPALYQKAQVTDRVQSRLERLSPKMEEAEAMARSMGYVGLDAMLEAAGRSGSGRDFQREARELMEARPQLMGNRIPDGVIEECRKGKSLLAAYTEYEAARQKAETELLRRELAVLKQNAAAAARAPVGGTREGGSADPFAGDDFLRGFNEGA